MAAPANAFKAFGFAALLASWVGPVLAQTERPQHSLPRIETNELEIVETLRPSSLAIGDVRAVFAHVLGSLRERVQVYPTENYYYFRFTHNGVRYAGNIRLAAADRDQGKLSFSYGEQPSDRNNTPESHYATLGAAEGVEVTKVAPLAYRVAFSESPGGKSVTFVLNDLSRVKPAPELLKADETFLGPIFDESGIRFFLIFNARLRVFHYLLDETFGIADELVAMRSNDRIQIGKRTGFAFYRDDRRKVLIGVDERQSRLNTYLDGPFDQLPENFIEGEVLRDAILAVSPEVKGRIDRLGNFTDGSGRYLIHPYLLYRSEADLAVFHRCTTDKRVAASERPRCFVIADEEQRKRKPLPLALKKR